MRLFFIAIISVLWAWNIQASYPWQGNLGNYDVSDLAEGLYIVEIVQEGRQISSNKIIVQH